MDKLPAIVPSPPSRHRLHKLTHLRQRLPRHCELGVEQRERVDHVRPDIERHAHTCSTGDGGNAHGIIEQRFRRANIGDYSRP